MYLSWLCAKSPTCMFFFKCMQREILLSLFGITLTFYTHCAHILLKQNEFIFIKHNLPIAIYSLADSSIAIIPVGAFMHIHHTVK